MRARPEEGATIDADRQPRRAVGARAETCVAMVPEQRTPRPADVDQHNQAHRGRADILKKSTLHKQPDVMIHDATRRARGNPKA